MTGIHKNDKRTSNVTYNNVIHSPFTIKKYAQFVD